MTTLHGRCRCGAVSVGLATRLAAERMPLLACSCDFCRRFRLLYTADPDGLLTIAVADPAKLRRYAFDGETAAALVCQGCGTVIGVVLAGEAERTALNVHCLDDRNGFTRTPTPLDYDAEAPDQRTARRRRDWTPTAWAFPAAD